MGSIGMTLVIGDQSGDRAGELGCSPLDGEYGLLRERRVRDVARAVAEPFNPKEERREGSVLGEERRVKRRRKRHGCRDARNVLTAQASGAAWRWGPRRQRLARRTLLWGAAELAEHRWEEAADGWA